MNPQPDKCGVGIVNTMQVLLSRRKTEIAMLKTTGYRRFDLYLLFGLEVAVSRSDFSPNRFLIASDKPPILHLF
jgi:hypothetical protein